MKKRRELRRKLQKFQVAIVIPDGCNIADVRDYMRDAIENWSGQFDPDNDPLFYAFCGPKNLTIKPLK